MYCCGKLERRRFAWMADGVIRKQERRMRQVALLTIVGLAMLGVGLSIGNLGETGQTLILAGAIVFVVYGSAAAVFIVALYGTFRLWKIVIDALQGAKTQEARALLQVI